MAPLLALDEAQTEEQSLHSEIVRLCDAQPSGERITLPAPPTPETLRMATPCPPRDDEPSLDTIPAPPPSAARKRTDTATAETESVPSTIPGPPRVPRIVEA